MSRNTDTRPTEPVLCCTVCGRSGPESEWPRLGWYRSPFCGACETEKRGVVVPCPTVPLGVPRADEHAEAA